MQKVEKIEPASFPGETGMSGGSGLSRYCVRLGVHQGSVFPPLSCFPAWLLNHLHPLSSFSAGSQQSPFCHSPQVPFELAHSKGIRLRGQLMGRTLLVLLHSLMAPQHVEQSKKFLLSPFQCNAQRLQDPFATLHFALQGSLVSQRSLTVELLGSLGISHPFVTCSDSGVHLQFFSGLIPAPAPVPSIPHVWHPSTLPHLPTPALLLAALPVSAVPRARSELNTSRGWYQRSHHKRFVIPVVCLHMNPESVLSLLPIFQTHATELF